MSGPRDTSAPSASSSNVATPPTPLWAINSLTFMASIGTGVVWNGIPFIAEQDYGFAKKTTLTLYLVMGVTYVIGAFSAGKVLRWLESTLSPRTALGAILLCESLVCLSLWRVRADWMFWVVACVMSMLSSWCWPIVESYLTAGRHGPRMRSAIGWWNMCWTGATAIAMVLMTFVMQKEARMAIVLLGALHAVALIPLMRFERHPGAHDHESSATAVQREYPFLLRAAHMLLPMAYVMVSGMGALMPYLMNSLHLDTAAQTPVASIWMWARIVSMAIMWQLGFWHGRWGTLLLGAVAMMAGFAMIVTGVSVPLMACGLAMFGAGMGIIYYAALYYAMSVGKAEVDAGGTFEALIGVGYAVGPLTGLISVLLSQGDEHRFTALTIGIVWSLILLTGISVVRPYRQARAGR